MPTAATGIAARCKRGRYIMYDVELVGTPPNLSYTRTDAPPARLWVMSHSAIMHQARLPGLVEQTCGSFGSVARYGKLRTLGKEQERTRGRRFSANQRL